MIRLFKNFNLNSILISIDDEQMKLQKSKQYIFVAKI